MNTRNGTALSEKPTRDRRVTIDIVVKVTETRPGPPRRETGSYTALVEGKAIATALAAWGAKKLGDVGLYVEAIEMPRYHPFEDISPMFRFP